MYLEKNDFSWNIYFYYIVFYLYESNSVNYSADDLLTIFPIYEGATEI